jgi:hypothetical protein
MDVLPVSTEVRAVPLKVLAIPADVGLVTRDVSLIIRARTLLGVVVAQIAFIRAQVGPVALDVLAVGADVRLVTTNVAPIPGHVVTIAVAIWLTARLLTTLPGLLGVAAVGVGSERVRLPARVCASVGHRLVRLLVVGDGRELIIRVSG